MRNPFDQFDQEQNPVQMFGAPDPAKALEVPLKQQDLRQGQVSIVGAQLGNEGKQYENQSKPTYDRNTALQGWVDNVRNDKRIQTYEQAVPLWSSGLKAPNTPEGDTMLTNAWAKVADPITGVQQGESKALEGQASSYEQVKARLLKEFGDDGSGNFTPEGRKRIKEAMTVRMRELADMYRFAREDWRQKVKTAGIPDLDPEVVLGPNAGIPFQKSEAAFIGRQPSLAKDRPDPNNFDALLKAALENPNRNPQERLQDALELSRQAGRPINMGDAASAANAGRLDNVEQDSSLLGMAKEAGSSLLNVGAGMAKGLTGLPDMLAKGAGQVMAAPLDWLGFDETAEQLRNPFQFGEKIDQAVPVPEQFSNDWWARNAASLVGGVAGLPKKATDNVVEQMVGRVPQGFNPATAPRLNPRETFDDAKSLGIEPTSEVVGGPTSRTMTSLLSQSLAGSAATKAGAERMVRQGGEALGNIAGRQGTALDREALGETARAGAMKYRDTSRAAAGKLYERAAKLAGDARVKPDKTIQELDRNIAELRQVPGGGTGLAYLQSLRDEIANNFPDGITVDGFRGMRTALRDRFMQEGLQGSDVERRVTGLVETVADDMAASLQAAGKPQAAQALKRADAAWAERARTLEQAVLPIIGRKGEKTSEQVAAALTSASRERGANLSRFIRALPEEEAGDVRASLVSALGRAKPGAQDETAEVFSFNELLTNWNRLGQSAKNALFVSPADRAAMDKLVKVSAEAKEASRYANTSRTGGVIINGLTIYTGAQDLITGGGVAAGTYVLAKAMASPGVARVVANMGSIRTPAQVKQAASQLEAIAKRYPGSAPGVFAIRDSLFKAMNDNARVVSGAAASDRAYPDRN